MLINSPLKESDPYWPYFHYENHFYLKLCNFSAIPVVNVQVKEVVAVVHVRFIVCFEILPFFSILWVKKRGGNCVFRGWLPFSFWKKIKHQTTKNIGGILLDFEAIFFSQGKQPEFRN